MGGPKTSKELGIRQHYINGICYGCRTTVYKRNALLGEKLNTPLGRDWRERAACGTADPTLFEEKTFSGPVKRLPEEILATAYRYCQGCPVLAECKAEADANPALRGLLGGVYRTLNLHTRKGQRSYRTFDLLSPDYDPGDDIRNGVLESPSVSTDSEPTASRPPDDQGRRGGARAASATHQTHQAG